MENPFLDDVWRFNLGQRQRVIPNDSSNEVYTADGEVIRGVIGFEVSPKSYDGKRFTKVYKDLWVCLMDLSAPAIKVLSYIAMTVGYEDVVKFDIARCMETTGYKNKPYIYKAIRELKEKGIIYPMRRGSYFINPMYLYKGDRTKLLK